MANLEGFRDKSPKKGKELPLYLVAALFVVFIIGFYFFFPDLIPSGDTNSSVIINQTDGRTTTRDAFLVNLIESEDLAVVMTVTNVTASQASMIYNCGVGFSGSWGSVGKNISNLELYVINGNECTYSTPGMHNQTNQSIVLTPEQCMTDYADTTRFDIRYGPSSTIFTNKSAFVLIDEQFDADCSFGIPRIILESTEPVPLLGNLTNDSSEESLTLDDLINKPISKEIDFVNESESNESAESGTNESTGSGETMESINSS